MSDIFICYSRSDGAIAAKLVRHLQAQGWSVFVDTRTQVGKRWHREIERELQAARAIVALWSAKSRDSDFVLEEAEYGKRKEILFPAFIERVEAPYGFGRIQTADLVGWAGAPDRPGLEQLVEPLRSHLGDEPGESLSGPATPAAPPWASPGRTFRDRLAIGGEGPQMVVIPAGRFAMGSPADEPERMGSEGPQHEVVFTKPFAMGVHAVTFDDYDRFCDAEKRNFPDDRGWGRGNQPAINVSWDDADAYSAWLGRQTGRAYRLPSEAEWEYACRAGTRTPFHFGARITTQQVNFDGNYTYNDSPKGEYRQRTVPVGSLPPNAFGLHEMHGNVWEWCQDSWHDNYAGAPDEGSAWEQNDGASRVLRGGSWGGVPLNCRAAFRYCLVPRFRDGYVGFRVCCSSPIG